MGFLSDLTPLWQIVGSLLFNIGLCIDAVLPSKFLCDWVLDSDALDGFAQIWEGLAPIHNVSQMSTALILEKPTILLVE